MNSNPLNGAAAALPNEIGTDHKKHKKDTEGTERSPLFVFLVSTLCLLCTVS